MDERDKRTGFLFFPSFLDALKMIPDEQEQARTILALAEYGVNGTMPDNLTPAGEIVFTLAKPTIDKYKSAKENGRKGGRPPKKTPVITPVKSVVTPRERVRVRDRDRETDRERETETERETDREGAEGSGADKSAGCSEGPSGPHRTAAPEVNLNLNLKGPPATPEGGVNPPGAGVPYTLQQCEHAARQNAINITPDGLRVFHETNEAQGWTINGEPVQLVRALRGFIKRHPEYEAKYEGPEEILTLEELDACDALIESYMPPWLTAKEPEGEFDLSLEFWEECVEPFPEVRRAVIRAYVPRRALVGFPVSLERFQQYYGVNLAGEPERAKSPAIKRLHEQYKEFMKY